MQRFWNLTGLLFTTITGTVFGDIITNTNQVTHETVIVVTASRVNTLLETTPELMKVISRKTIEETRPYKTGELIEYTTGTGTATGTGSGQPKRTVVSLNGLPAHYTMVLVDGVPLLTEHIHTGQNIEMVPAESIERIEIMRGAASAQYGSDAIGGVVNIITRKAIDHPDGNIGMTIGSHNTYENFLSLRTPLAKGVGLSSFINWEKSDGQPLLKPAHRIGNVGYENLTFFNRIDAEIGEDTRTFVAFNGALNKMEWNDDWANSRLLTPSAGLDQQLTPDLLLSTRISYSDWDAEVSDERNRLVKPETYLRWEALENHTLMTGGDYRYNSFERTGLDAPAQQAFGLFMQDEWNALEDLYITTALRYDKTENIEGALSPKIAALWLPVERVALRASIARGFHAPTLQELYEEGYGHGGTAYRFGNPDLKPEYSTAYMLGLEIEPMDKLQLMLNLFYTDFQDMIVPVYQGPWSVDPSKDVWERTNIQDAEVYGWDAGFLYQFTSQFYLEGGCTYTDNRNKETGRNLPYSPGISTHSRAVLTSQVHGHDVTAFLGLRSAFNREAWDWKPAAGTSSTNPDGLTYELEDYYTFDAGITIGITKYLDMFAKVENLLGRDIENLDDSYTVLDGAPFFRVGFKYNFLHGE